jgi:hypothetical protein
MNRAKSETCLHARLKSCLESSTHAAIDVRDDMVAGELQQDSHNHKGAELCRPASTCM